MSLNSDRYHLSLEETCKYPTCFCSKYLVFWSSMTNSQSSYAIASGCISIRTDWSSVIAATLLPLEYARGATFSRYQCDLVLQFASTVVLDGHRSRAGVLLLRHKLTICSPIVQVCFVECFGIGWPWHWLRQVGMRVENWEVPWHKAPYSILDPTGFIRTLRVCYCVPLSVAWDHQEQKWPEYHHPIGQLQ